MQVLTADERYLKVLDSKCRQCMRGYPLKLYKVGEDNWYCFSCLKKNGLIRKAEKPSEMTRRNWIHKEKTWDKHVGSRILGPKGEVLLITK